MRIDLDSLSDGTVRQAGGIARSGARGRNVTQKEGTMPANTQPILSRLAPWAIVLVSTALPGCSEDNPGRQAATEPRDGVRFETFTGAENHRVRFERKAPAQVWLRFDCRLTTGDFQLKGTAGFEFSEKGGPIVQAPVPLTIRRDGVSADGLPRTRDGIVGLRERTFEGAQHLSGYAYLFDLPATSEQVTITGSVEASGAVCTDGLGQYTRLYFTQ